MEFAYSHIETIKLSYTEFFVICVYSCDFVLYLALVNLTCQPFFPDRSGVEAECETLVHSKFNTS